MRRDARLALRLVLDEHVRPRPAATQTTAAPRVRRVGLRLGPRGQVDVAPAALRRRRPVADLLPIETRHVLVVRDEPDEHDDAEDRNRAHEVHDPGVVLEPHLRGSRVGRNGLARRGRGTWAAYRRLPRKEVLRLRSLSKRGRAKATDPTIDRVFQLPNELAWCVLDFWRATSAATGEVI